MKTSKRLYCEFGADMVENDYAYSLAGNLQCSRVEAAAYIALLIGFGLGYSDDDGILDFLTTKAIESGCFWEGARGELLAAFIKSGVVVGERDSDTRPLRIAPTLWNEFAGKALHERIEARKRKQKQRNSATIN